MEEVTFYHKYRAVSGDISFLEKCSKTSEKLQ